MSITASAVAARIARSKTVLPARGRQPVAGGLSSTRRIPAAKASTPSPVNTPVPPSTTVSMAPPRPRATTGVPHACASTGTRPKSSSPGSSTIARATVHLPYVVIREERPGTRRRGHPTVPAPRASGPWPTTVSGTPTSPAGRHGDIDALVRHQGRHDQRETFARDAAPGVKYAVSTGGYTTADRRL